MQNSMATSILSNFPTSSGAAEMMKWVQKWSEYPLSFPFSSLEIWLVLYYVTEQSVVEFGTRRPSRVVRNPELVNSVLAIWIHMDTNSIFCQNECTQQHKSGMEEGDRKIESCNIHSSQFMLSREWGVCREPPDEMEWNWLQFNHFLSKEFARPIIIFIDYSFMGARHPGGLPMHFISFQLHFRLQGNATQNPQSFTFAELKV